MSSISVSVWSSEAPRRWAAALCLLLLPAAAAAKVFHSQSEALALAFPPLSASVIARALWTHLSWGSYWTWRPAGLWVLVLWLILAATLHIRTSERRVRWATAALAILGCILALGGLPLLGSGLTAAW